MMSWVRKPLLGREGANITLHQPGAKDLETAGDYGEEGFIYQDLSRSKTTMVCTPSWAVGSSATKKAT